MATLKEFEDILRQNGMLNALALLEGLKKRDREIRSIAPARRVAGRKMTAELARTILDFHASTGMTQQEIAFKFGVNQGRVNEVIKRGKWLNADPAAPEALSRDKAMQRLDQRARSRRETAPVSHAAPASPVAPVAPATPAAPVLPVAPARPIAPAKPVMPVAPATPAMAARLSPPPVRVPAASLDGAVRRPTKVVGAEPKPPRAPHTVLRAQPRIISAQLAFLDL